MDDLPDLSKLADAELIELYESKEAEDRDAVHIANEMGERGGQPPPCVSACNWCPPDSVIGA